MHLRRVAIGLDPVGHILSVSRQPRNLGSDRVLALRKRLVESVVVLAAKELVDSIQLFLRGKARGQQRHHGAEHGQGGWVSLVELVPVVGHPGVQRLDTLGMGAQPRSRHVHILVLDLAAQQKGQGSLDELRVLGATKRAETGILLIAVGRCTVQIHNLVILHTSYMYQHHFVTINDIQGLTYLFLAAKLEGNSKHALADVGVNGRLVASHKLVKHVLGSRNNHLVAAEAGAAKERGLELLLNVAVGIGKLPSELVGLGADELSQEGSDTVPDGLVFKHPGGLDGTNAGNNLVPHHKLGLRPKALEKVEDARRLPIAGAGQRGSIGDQTSPILRRQKAFLGGLAELLQAARRVQCSVDSSVVGVELEEVGAGQLVLLLSLLEGHRLINAILGSQAQEDGVQDLVFLGLHVAGAEEAVLLDVDGVLALLLGDGQDGVSDALGPGSHDLVDGLAADGSQRVPKIAGLRVAVGVLLQVLANTLQELVLAQVCRDHAEHTGSLGVGNGIEDLVNLISALHGDLNRVAAAEGVERQRGLQVISDVGLPNAPFWVKDVARVPRGPGGKSLVEPKTLPPVHGDQVTKPLVRQLVLDNLGHTLLGGGAAGLFVKHQVDNAVRDQAPVLHGALGKVGNSNLVHLGQGEVDAKRLFVKRQRLGSEVDGEAAVLDIVAGRSIDSHGDSEIARLDVVELADNKGKQVCRHEGRGVEVDSLSGSAGDLGRDLRLRGDIHVAQARQVLVRNERDGELCLERGLVKAGQGSAGVRGLKLGARQDTLGAVWSLVCGAVETGHLVVELASEVDGQLHLGVLCERVRAAKVELGDLGSFIVRDGRGGATKNNRDCC